ncbi:MAG: calcium-binding protein, partial [Pseudomonadota bacterium]
WLRRTGSDLELSVIGTGDTITIGNWYGGSACQVEQIALATGKSLAAGKVNALVDAMAAFAPPAAGQTTLPANYQTALNGVIAANWV